MIFLHDPHDIGGCYFVLWFCWSVFVWYGGLVSRVGSDGDGDWKLAYGKGGNAMTSGRGVRMR